METKTINSYLTFQIDKEEFAINVGRVLNILELCPITEVPQSPNYMKGVINLRGSVLPIIDTKIKFGLHSTEFTSNTCILVLEVEVDGETVQVGALADSVQEVLIVDDTAILPPPSLGSKYRSEMITGMIKHNEQFIMILNVDLIFGISINKEIVSELVSA